MGNIELSMVITPSGAKTRKTQPPNHFVVEKIKEVVTVWSDIKISENKDQFFYSTQHWCTYVTAKYSG